MTISAIIERKQHELNPKSLVFFLWFRDKYPDGADMNQIVEKYPTTVTRRSVTRYMQSVREAGLVRVSGSNNEIFYTPKI